MYILICWGKNKHNFRFELRAYAVEPLNYGHVRDKLNPVVFCPSWRGCPVLNVLNYMYREYNSFGSRTMYSVERFITQCVYYRGFTIKCSTVNAKHPYISFNQEPIDS